MVLPIMSVRWHPGHPDRNSDDRVYDISCDVRPSRVDGSVHREEVAERSYGWRRTPITLTEVESHRSRSSGTKT